MLEASGLECERGGRVLFRGLSLGLAAGELVRVAGPNGSGKTSLLRILCGLLAPSAGEVKWDGEPIRSLREEYSTKVVYLGHAPAVKDDLTAAENLKVSMVIAGAPAAASAIHEALRRYGVPDAPVRKLSQGQRRRAALARLLLSDAAPLWLLDEPFYALDAAATDLTGDLVKSHVARGGAVVYTTHQDVGLQHTRRVDLGA